MLLKDLTWPEVKSLDFDKLVVIFPTGSFEQHGPHLPFTTDTDIVSAIAEGVERAMADRVLLVPTLWPGFRRITCISPARWTCRRWSTSSSSRNWASRWRAWGRRRSLS